MRKSLKIWCIENEAEYIIKEWDEESNGKLDEKISYASTRKVNWKCKKGHSWKATIGQRTGSKSGCPYCSGRYAIPHETDLLTLFPNVAKEWDYKKNIKNPINVKPSSHEKVWWKCCVCGNEWNAVISSRTRGCGCPECGKLKIAKARRTPKESQSLKDVCPELLKEWDYTKNKLKPENISALSHEKVWWKCQKCKYEWEAMISNRVRGRKCPCCSNKKIVAGYNDFATKYPKLAEEWNYEKNEAILPTQVAPSSSKKVWWKCRVCSHEWDSSVNNRIKRGCPNCSKSRTISFPEKIIFYYMSKVFEEVLENYRPDFLQGKEIDVFIPKINVGIEYDGELYHQNRRRDIDKIVECNENGIVLLRVREPGCPDLGDGFTVFTLESRDTDSYEKMIKNIVDFLVNKKYLNTPILDIDLKRDTAEINDLVNYQDINKSIKITNPELVPFWNNEKNGEFTMDKVSYASDKKVWWKCQKCNYEWFGKIYSMTRKKGKNLCPECKKRDKSLARSNPELIGYWDYSKNPEDI